MRLSRLITVGIATLSLVSCGPSKLEQCKQFANEFSQAQILKNEFETEIDSFTQQVQGVDSLGDISAAATQYISAVEKLVGGIDGMVVSLNDLELSDRQLIEYRDGYADIMSRSAQELNVASEAMELVGDIESETDLSNVLEEFQGKINTAFVNLQNLSQDEAALVGNINTYCGAEAPVDTEAETPETPTAE